VTDVAGQVHESDPVRVVRDAAADTAGSAWVVGGAVRDAVLGRPITDVDLVTEGEPQALARAVAAAAGGPVFPLSEEFGAWRVIAAKGFICDVSPLHGESIEEDLAKRDFSANAMAVPLDRQELLDPWGGRDDLEAGVLRVLGEQAYRDDPLRPLRLARLATELSLEPDAETERLTRAYAQRVPETSPERVWAELRRLVTADRVLDGLGLADRLGLTDAVLPELANLRGVEQSHFHHLDVHGHTLEVLRQQIGLETDLDRVFGPLAPRLRGVLEEPLSDELTRMQALRFAALVHDMAKPATRRELPDGRISFLGHDQVGEDLVVGLCRRLRTSERLASFLGGVTRHHLVLGFLVHQRPLDRRAVYHYLRTCEPVEVEVTVFSCADRRATRGRNADAAIAAHLGLAREIMEPALAWRSDGAPKLPLRGDELARELDIERGPELGRLLEAIREAVFAGEVQDRDQAVGYARALRNDYLRGASGPAS
jgi:tRNA nucleotidyltransferase/poly(A) polymerase